MEKFTHIDADGNAVMVDVGDKAITKRRATAAGRIRMQGATLAAVRSGAVKKGDVLAVAQVAGIMAAKGAGNLIPLCHPLMLTSCKVTFSMQADAIEVRCMVQCEGQTGVEMEALTGASVALLTIYDMCKALDKTMEIGEIRVLEKSGGRSGDFRREEGADAGSVRT